MNSLVTKPSHRYHSDFTIGPGRRQRRRQRNRSRYYKIKKRRLKKVPYNSKPGSFKLDFFNFKPDCGKIMSNWYWSNYRKALEWQDRHKVAHWKACALALYEENRYLLEIINHMQHGMIPGGPVFPKGRGVNFNFKRTRMNYKKYHPGKYSHQNNVEEDDNDNQDEDYAEENNDNNEETGDDIEFEMSEEMMQFFEQSYKHKMDLKKLKEEEKIKNTENEIQQIQNNKMKRTTEMSFLYGDGASMITGMETAVQLSFDKYCDIKSPKYWPNIPFRL